MIAAGGVSIVPQSMHAVAKLAAYAPDIYAVKMLSTAVTAPLVRSNPTSLDILSAATVPANALRKLAAKMASSAKPQNLITSFGGLQPALNTATALESAASLISTGFSLSKGNKEPFSGQGHVAAVAMALAAKLRTACCRSIGSTDEEGEEKDEEDLSSRRPFVTVVDWESPIWKSLGHQESSVFSSSELCWLSSTLHNLGVELVGEGLYDPAGDIFRAALTAALSVLAQHVQSSSSQCLPGQMELSSIVEDVARRTVALAEAMKKKGRNIGVTAEESLMRVLELGGNTLYESEGAVAQLHEMVATVVELRFQSKQSLLGQASLACAPPQGKGRRGGKQTKANANKRHRITTESQCLVAWLGAHPRSRAVPTQLLALVARAELSACAARVKTFSFQGSSPEEKQQAKQWAASAAQHVLESMYPVDQFPVQHCRTLLLLHSLELAHDDDIRRPDADNEHYLSRAVEILRRASSCKDKEESAVQILLALALATRMLEDAQAVVAAAVSRQRQHRLWELEEIKRNPSQVHEDHDEFGGDGGSRSNTEEEEISICGGETLSWEGILSQAPAVSLVLAKATCVDVNNDESDIAALIDTLAEIAVVVGLHGKRKLEKELLDGLLNLKARLPPQINDDGNTTAAAAAIATPILESCILPAIPKTASSTPVSELEDSYEELAASGDRAPSTLIRRAELAVLGSLTHATTGDIVAALHWAGEAHRITGPVAQLPSTSAISTGVEHDHHYVNSGSRRSCNSNSVGGGPSALWWWRMVAMHCKSLLLLARLFEGSGMVDEAMYAIKEGLSMVRTQAS